MKDTGGYCMSLISLVQKSIYDRREIRFSPTYRRQSTSVFNERATQGTSHHPAMQKFIPAVLLILQCCIYLTAGQLEFDNMTGIPSIGTVNFMGQVHQVFEVQGVQIAEPRISFDSNCGSLRYNRMFQKYQITLPFKIDVNIPTLNSKKSGKMTIFGLNMIADMDLVNNDSVVKAKMKLLTDAGEAELLLLCDSFERCYSLMQEIGTNPDDLHPMVRLVISGKLGSSRLKFRELRILGTPKFNCHYGKWEVFQRRIDGSLSFAESWDAYEKGFGNPDSNYWMGLRLLSAKTVTGMGSFTTRCQLRIETQDFNNNSYWAEYRFFQVFGPEESYIIKFSDNVTGSTLPISSIEYHNNMPFSTFDRDHDAASTSCSRYQSGYGGWWFRACSQWHLNSAYPYDSTVINQEPYIGVLWPDRRIAMRSTTMMVKCNY